MNIFDFVGARTWTDACLPYDWAVCRLLNDGDMFCYKKEWIRYCDSTHGMDDLGNIVAFDKPILAIVEGVIPRWAPIYNVSEIFS